ncbi:Repressible high-affinity phosphate permease [Neolecta irregularis DAH-3]|uniref:Repressible high-affinity phosphate permease n=1 Tax=Neolecta irregularis (strain DAH-3) TaxID=1198029 RepID=A0A1U7LNR4_NEOID|nr:Repressible high-affinity phosphate permease [Neolecta irregularis DAH-3]|eukprot:OLL24310.1 Repressible high-affinity phosphate permease [Neolecta irregularis DAH-3]
MPFFACLTLHPAFKISLSFFHPAMSSSSLSPAPMDPNERRLLALEEIDNAKFGWYHIRAVAIAGIGFFTDAYDIFAINVVSVCLGYVYYRDVTHKATLPSHLDEALKVGTSAGAVFGQLFFGWLSDRYGRRKIYGFELIIIIFATVATALSGGGPAFHAVGAIIFWRLLLGIGIGGDYPQSAIITSEFASTRHRGRMMAAVFSMQGLGIVAGAIVFLISVLGFKHSIKADELLYPFPTSGAAGNVGLPSVDKIWRLVIGIGAIPAVIALYFRLTIPETPRYTIDIEKNIEAGKKTTRDFLNGIGHADTEAVTLEDHVDEIPSASTRDFFRHFMQWKHGKVLLGTAFSWFFLDIAFYGLGLNNSIVLQAIGYAGQHDVYLNLRNIAVGNIILNLVGSLPGYWVSVAFIDTIGRKPIQIGGFAILTTLFLVLGCAYWPLHDQESKAGFIALFVMAQFFFNFGPNTTTFVVPGEVFPTRYRSTAHGISAASGKTGAIMAQVIFSPLANRGGKNQWLNHILQIFAAFMFLGFLSSFLIPETNGKTLEELSGENQRRFIPMERQADSPASSGSIAQLVDLPKVS